ncbi:MAG: hypothetical protein J5929_07000 [Eubacterium sp.]|nr:hypothetical protein [Eubacterium sp.]
MQLKPEVKSGDEQTDNLKAKREEAQAIEKMLGVDGVPDYLRDGVDTLPTYKDPTAVKLSKAGRVNLKTRSRIYKIIGIVLLLGFVFLIYIGIRHMLFADGEDISNKLGKTEEEISSNLGITFKDDVSELYKIPRYTNANVTAKSGDEINLIFANGKMVGVNTSGRKYKLFGIGINEPGYNVTKKITFKYEDEMMVLNDLFEGNTEARFFRNFTTNECLVVVLSKQTNRVIGVTYYNNMKQMTEKLSG